MTLRPGGVRVRIHPLLPLLLLLSAALGQGEAVCAACGAFLLHEIGHLCAARLFGLRPSEAELTPFGAVMTLEGMESAGCAAAFLVALGGPLFSLLGFLLCPLLLRFTGLSFFLVAAFARYQWMLFLVNLLPALPLDGGRMLLAVLKRFLPEQAVRRSLTGLAFCLGGGLALLSLVFALQGELNFVPCFAGCYLIYAALRERRQLNFAYITGLIARRQKLAEGRALPVQWTAASGDLPLRKVIPCLTPGKYHIISVLSPDGLTILGCLSEQQLCDGLLDNADAALKSCLSASPVNKKAPGATAEPFPGAQKKAASL